ncbi:MAG TPA: hypothetical protein VLS27_12295, partial [Gammaproteobacteria bacterium]|nr:hypothetical protein [Gammaproteobacteria bacterium]
LRGTAADDTCPYGSNAATSSGVTRRRPHPLEVAPKTIRLGNGIPGRLEINAIGRSPASDLQ